MNRQNEDVEDFLVHYGVKGMRWGVRKKGVSSSGKKARSSKQDDPKKLSDDELRARLQRLNMEKQYRELSGTQAVFNGRKAAGNILQNSGTAVGTTVLTATALYGIKRGITAAFGKEVTAQVFPRKK